MNRPRLSALNGDEAAKRAVYANRWLKSGIGRETMLFGETLSVAARVQAAAEPDAVIVTASVQRQGVWGAARRIARSSRQPTDGALLCRSRTIALLEMGQSSCCSPAVVPRLERNEEALTRLYARYPRRAPRRAGSVGPLENHDLRRLADWTRARPRAVGP